MTQDVVSVVEDAVEQIVIGFTAQVGERRQALAELIVPLFIIFAVFDL